MRSSPSIAPRQPDNVYLVLDDFGEPLGRAWREVDEIRTDRETVIIDLMDGQYSNPMRVIAFNTSKGFSRDVSENLADEIARFCAMDGFDVPPHLEAFVDRHAVAGRRSCHCR